MQISRARTRFVGLAAAALLPLCPLPAHAGPAPAGRLAPATASPQLQALLDELVGAGATGALAVIGDGTQTWHQAAGVARRSQPTALTTAARFRAGSVTKTFIATLALQLVGEGRLALTDTVEHWLPGLLAGGDAITLRMLLNHTSGLYDYAEDAVLAQQIYTDPTTGVSPRTLVDIANSYPPLFAPGQHWRYSNTNYIVAGMIIEAATHRSVQQLLQSRIIAPLHLTGTSFPSHDRDLRGYHAHGYRPPTLSGAGYLNVTMLAPSLFWAAGALISTADDLRGFYAALLGGRLLPPDQLTDLLAVVPVDPVFGYGLGIGSVRGPCGTVWGHEGALPGYTSYAFADRTGERTGVVMMSTEPDAMLGPLLELTVQTAICQMFDRVPVSGTGGYAALHTG